MIKSITPETYEIVVDWWQRHNFHVIPYEMLPKRGYISYIDEMPIAAGFLYIPEDDDGKIAFSCWYVRNPAATPADVDLGFTELGAHIQKVCKEKGIWGCFTFTGVPALIDRLEALDYIPVETGQTMITVFPQD